MENDHRAAMLTNAFVAIYVTSFFVGLSWWTFFS
jgi:hypothetical protein